eukprot:TRINITY_DN17315_c0_g1_i1.p1 TRINITY_DN17315_c0_g1~~TRINITY_DN17315_c0_g1_i1.p1  ORF type:complete len:132 (-),score=19.23 TRINITY_DN17315_c0_g1_i1:146-541(-)
MCIRDSFLDRVPKEAHLVGPDHMGPLPRYGSNNTPSFIKDRWSGQPAPFYVRERTLTVPWSSPVAPSPLTDLLHKGERDGTRVQCAWSHSDRKIISGAEKPRPQVYRAEQARYNAGCNPEIFGKRPLFVVN